MFLSFWGFLGFLGQGTSWILSGVAGGWRWVWVGVGVRGGVGVWG